MGYDKDGRYIVRSNYSFAEWMRIMKGELDESVRSFIPAAAVKALMPLCSTVMTLKTISE